MRNAFPGRSIRPEHGLEKEAIAQRGLWYRASGSSSGTTIARHGLSRESASYGSRRQMNQVGLPAVRQAMPAQDP
jgi:hypothetical protein